MMMKKELVVFAHQRKSQYEDGEPFHFHTLASAEEATELVTAAEKAVADLEAEVRNTNKYKATHVLYYHWTDPLASSRLVNKGEGIAGGMRSTP